MTEISVRDLAIVRFVAQFRQVTSRQVSDLLFATNTSRTPADRSLKRLVAEKWLVRIERRLVGGGQGGSGQYCYSLGRRGFHMFLTGEYRQARSVQPHTIAIAELYVTLKRYERAQLLTVTGLSTEPHCWVQLGALELKPDLLVELERPDGRRFRLFAEVDMGTEGQKQLKGKLRAVVEAWSVSGEYGWTAWPPTVWVCIDQERVTELRWLISQLPEHERPLFRVCTLDSLPEVLNVSYPQECIK